MSVSSSPTTSETFSDRLGQARRAISERLRLPARAFSTDGHTFHFEAPVEEAPPVGRYVRLRTSSGQEYLGAVKSHAIAHRTGPSFTLTGDAGLGLDELGISVAESAFTTRLRFVEGDGTLLTRLQSDGSATTLSASDVFDEAEIATATASDIAHYLTASTRGRRTLPIGGVLGVAEPITASILAAGFDRHTFLCGQSGSGKTYALGVMLERLLLETDLRLIIIDPNSDFVSLGHTRPLADINRGLSNPLTDKEYAAYSERLTALNRQIEVRRRAPHGQRRADALRLHFSELPSIVQGHVLRMDPLRDSEELNAAKTIVRHLKRDVYTLADVHRAAASDLSVEARNVALRINNLNVTEWDVWADADEESLLSVLNRDWRALVLDIGGFSLQSEKSLVAAAVLGALWNQRERREPVLIVVDEAHTICPDQPETALQQVALDQMIRIAGEGRKFGLYLLLATQRPRKIHANVLSQSDNLTLMRMNSENDLEHLAEIFSFVPPALLERSTSFRQGQALLAGKIVPSPMLVQFEGRLTQEGGGDVPATWAGA